tara:strand:+ start:6856 stop:7242 length:387 start_codon:yes stop_codon:yes gene_type:complete
MLAEILYFLSGMIFMYTLRYVADIGHSISLLKRTQHSCAALFIASEEGLQQILFLKYLAMEEANRTKQNIISQKYIDQLNIDNIKKSIMKTYSDSFPSAYSHVIEYETWEELEGYVDKFIKTNKEKKS